MASGDVHLIKDLPSMSTPACEGCTGVPHFSMQLFSKMHFQHHSYITDAAPSPLLPFFIYWFLELYFQRWHCPCCTVPFPPWDESSLMNSLPNPPKNKQQPQLPGGGRGPHGLGLQFWLHLVHSGVSTTSSCALYESWSALPFLSLIPALTLLLGRELNLGLLYL